MDCGTRHLLKRVINLREAKNLANHCLVEIKPRKRDGCSLEMERDNAGWSAVWEKGKKGC